MSAYKTGQDDFSGFSSEEIDKFWESMYNADKQPTDRNPENVRITTNKKEKIRTVTFHGRNVSQWVTPKYVTKAAR